jgi:hypothetical protein
MFWWAVVLDGVVKVVWKERRVQASRRRGLASGSVIVIVISTD